MDVYRGFIAGQRNNDPQKGQGVAEYLEDWEDTWKKMSGSKDTQGISDSLSQSTLW